MLLLKFTREESFQPTYEELKQMKEKIEKEYGEVFSLPMRNWNGDRQLRLRSSVWGFQPTYEELKPRKMERYMTMQ